MSSLAPPKLLRSQTTQVISHQQKPSHIRLPGSSPSSRPLPRRGVRRTRTMPARTRSMPSSSKTSSSNNKSSLPTNMISSTKKLFDFSAVQNAMDDASTSATSFLSMSFSTHSHHSRRPTVSSTTGSMKLAIMAGTNPTELCVDHLDDFVSRILPANVDNTNANGNCQEVLSQIQYDVHLYWQLQARGDPVTQTTLSDIELGLTSILESTPSLPATIVAELHSYRGLLHLQRENAAAAAVESFTRALWLQSHMNRLHHSSSSDAKTTSNSNHCPCNKNDAADHLWNMAVTEHRLGVAYGRSGKYLKAIDQMEHAILSYTKAGVGISEACFVAAKEDLHEFQEGHQISLLRNSGRPMRHNLLVGSRHGSQHHRSTITNNSTGSGGGGQRARQSSLKSSQHQPKKVVPEEVRLALEQEMDLSHDSFVY